MPNHLWHQTLNLIYVQGPAENENEEAKGDLKSRGLCLVPLSCLSYITDGGGAAVWPPPYFGGATQLIQCLEEACSLYDFDD